MSDEILSTLLALALGYIITYGMKDREPPTVSINLPTNGYEFRAFKKISVTAQDNKGVKDVTYKIDGEVYHVENSSSSSIVDVWNPSTRDISWLTRHSTILPSIFEVMWIVDDPIHNIARLPTKCC